MHWLKDLKVRIRFKEPLNIHTTLHIGGPADVWVEPGDFEELREVVCRCIKKQLPYLVIGRGSNILVSDDGFRGVVICLSSPAFSAMAVKGSRLICGAGLTFNKLIRQAQKRGLGGLEFLAGIPASVAGAVVMNAGNRNMAIGSLVESVTAMDRKGKLRLLKKNQLKFGYRRSNLNGYIVLKAELGLVKRSPKKINQNIAANLAQKRRTQDLTSKSAGCIFKDPPHPRLPRDMHGGQDLSAGEMIEACGLKRRRRGGAEISPKHANYIINRNGAKARDVLYLMDLAQRQVKKKFGVQLEPEIKIIGNNPNKKIAS